MVIKASTLLAHHPVSQEPMT